MNVSGILFGFFLTGTSAAHLAVTLFATLARTIAGTVTVALDNFIWLWVFARESPCQSHEKIKKSADKADEHSQRNQDADAQKESSTGVTVYPQKNVVQFSPSQCI
jgi:hypothetical protein